MIENIHITILIFVILSFLDYFLTIKGFKSYKEKYSKFVKIESYELNPMFKKDIRKLKYNFKHLFFVVFASVLVFGVYHLSQNNLYGFKIRTFFFLQGIIFSMLIYLNINHLGNIILFKMINNNPKLLSGKIKHSYLFSLKTNMIMALKFFIILFVIFIFNLNAFTFGFALGPLVLLIKLYFWSKKKIRR